MTDDSRKTKSLTDIRYNLYFFTMYLFLNLGGFPVKLKNELKEKTQKVIQLPAKELLFTAVEKLQVRFIAEMVFNTTCLFFFRI